MLRSDASTTIPYPVQYTNLPLNKMLLENLPSHLLVKVEASGYILLKYKIQPPLTALVFNVKEHSLRKVKDTKNTYKFFILTDQLKDEIQQQLSHGVEVKNILPDSLIFKFADIVNKKVPVLPNVKLEIEKPFMLKDMLLSEPDSINISGPRSIIDTIRFVTTKCQVIKNIRNATQRNLALESIRDVTFSNKRVIIKIPVEQFTEANISIPLEVIKLPDGIGLKIFPRNISVSCLVALSDYEKLNKSLFSAYVDFSSIENTLTNKLKVQLDMYPDFIKSVKYNPKSVDYIIEK